MDWAGWALFGLLAMAALTAVMIAAQKAGLTRLDGPLVLGACTPAHRPSRWARDHTSASTRRLDHVFAPGPGHRSPAHTASSESSVASAERAHKVDRRVAVPSALMVVLTSLGLAWHVRVPLPMRGLLS